VNFWTIRDPYQCHLRIHLAVSKLFHIGLPLLLNGYLWDPLGVKLVNWFASLETLEDVNFGRAEHSKC
jgi:hypothetical protein